MSNSLTVIRLKSLSLRTPHWMYAGHRFLFRLTNGGWNRLFAKIVQLVNGKYSELRPAFSIFQLDDRGVLEAVADMRENGFHTFKKRISEETVNRLVSFSRSTPIKAIMPASDYSKDGSNLSAQEFTYADVAFKYARCPHPANYILANKDIHKLMTDPSLLALAQEYFGSKPILSSVEMWWSFPVEDSERFAAAAAQKYHFDMDHVNFFNVFIYLTDVHEDNGPHCFVKKTHRYLPKFFRKRGRFEDADIAKFYPAEDIVEIKGLKGTVSAVDTKGLHKGKILTRDPRLILQLHFTCSLFGNQYEQHKVTNVDQDTANFMKNHPETYFNFF